MATYVYKDLKSKYDDFYHPMIVLKINGKDFSENSFGFVVSDIEVDLTCGFEASVASFVLYDTFDIDASAFRIEDAKPYIMLGSKVEIALGYSKTAQEVFCGYIARVNFQYTDGDMPGIRITAMDVKGAMMANCYSKQISAKTYSEAVRELFKRMPFVNQADNALASAGGADAGGNTNFIVEKLILSDTPDKTRFAAGGAPEDRTVEMTAESDYEFVVKAAKRYQFEFFTECGNVYFRKAKDKADTLIEMGPGEGLWNFDVEYDITGLVAQVEARGMDTGKGEWIRAKKDLKQTISIGNRAKKMIKNSAKVYLDASIHSKSEAEDRANSLAEEISYRLGTLECDCVGLPELLPGNFFVLKGVGAPPENQFYLHRVVHKMNQEDGFVTKLYGRANSIQK